MENCKVLEAHDSASLEQVVWRFLKERSLTLENTIVKFTTIAGPTYVRHTVLIIW